MGKKSKKKKRGFEWVRDDVDEQAVELVERRNRSALKRRMSEVEALAKAMAELQPGERRRLPLEPYVIEAANELANTKPTPDRRRKLLRLKTMLAELDDDLLDEVRAWVR